jgi:hypothetical protein
VSQAASKSAAKAVNSRDLIESLQPNASARPRLAEARRASSRKRTGRDTAPRAGGTTRSTRPSFGRAGNRGERDGGDGRQVVEPSVRRVGEKRDDSVADARRYAARLTVLPVDGSTGGFFSARGPTKWQVGPLAQ